MPKLLKNSLLFVLIITSIIFHLRCQSHQSPGYGRGENFPVLAFPEGIGTLIFFFVPDEFVNGRIKFDIALVNEKYGKNLRLILVDINSRSTLTERHRIRNIPTLILFDNMGTEIYRWLPWDFRSDFSSRDIEREIEKLPPPIINNN